MTMAKKKGNLVSSANDVGSTINTTAIVNQLTVGAHKDKISFTALNLEPEQNEIVADMVKNERSVLMTIAIDGAPDPNLPPIQVSGQMKGYKIAKTCDSPNVVNIQFSSNQVSQLTGYIRGEHIILLKFTEKEPGFDFEGADAGDVGE